MPDGAVLAWSRTGDVQVRGRDGRWSAARHLPVSFLESARVDGGETYLLGQTIEQPSRRLTSHVFEVSSSSETVEVTAGGKDAVEGRNLLVPRRGLAPIRCTPADLSKASYRPAACHSDSPPWDAAGSWTLPPFACGGALVERDPRHVTTRSLADGHVLGSKRIEQTAALACGDDSLLVGTDRIQALDPATLRPRWSIPASDRRVTALCATPTEIVYFTPSGPRATPNPHPQR